MGLNSNSFNNYLKTDLNISTKKKLTAIRQIRDNSVDKNLYMDIDIFLLYKNKKKESIISTEKMRESFKNSEYNSRTSESEEDQMEENALKFDQNYKGSDISIMKLDPKDDSHNARSNSISDNLKKNQELLKKFDILTITEFKPKSSDREEESKGRARASVRSKSHEKLVNIKKKTKTVKVPYNLVTKPGKKDSKKTKAKRFASPSFNRFFKSIVYLNKINSIIVQNRASSHRNLQVSGEIQLDSVQKYNYEAKSDNEIDRIKNILSKRTENKLISLLLNIKQQKSISKGKATMLEEQRILDKDVKQFIDFKNSQFKSTKKKIIQSSLYYNDWSKETANAYPYYYISTAITKFKEMNITVNKNPFLVCGNMEIEDYFEITKFELTESLKECKVFVYDNKTAVIYKIQNIDRSPSSVMLHDTFSKLIVNNENEFVEKKYKKSDTIKLFKEGKQDNFIFIVLNDFFEKFTKYEEVLTNGLSNFSKFLSKIKIVYLNLPGQEYSTFSKKETLNNMYYSEFLDKFLFHLSEKGVFDHTYHVILLGFGNGGHIAMTFASCYEKYWDFIHSIILFNTYVENDDFMNKSLIEVMKIIETDKSSKLVDFFIKSVTVNPKKLFDLESSEGEGNFDDISLKHGKLIVFLLYYVIF